MLDLPAAVLDTLILQQLADLTDPTAFGQTFAETRDRRIREFQLAAMIAQGNDGSRFGPPFYCCGHPDFNDQAAIVLVHYLSSLHSSEEPIEGQRTVLRAGTVDGN